MVIRDTTGQTLHLRDEYLIAVIRPGPLTPGDGKCRVIFVGGVVEVSQADAHRIAAIIDADDAPVLNRVERAVLGAAVDS